MRFVKNTNRQSVILQAGIKKRERRKQKTRYIEDLGSFFFVCEFCSSGSERAAQAAAQPFLAAQNFKWR